MREDLVDLPARIAEDVELVNEINENRAAVGPHAPPTDIEVAVGFHKRPHHGYRQEVTDLSARDDVMGRLHQRVVAPVVADKHPGVRSVGEFGYAKRRFRGVGDGLFDERVDSTAGASLERLDVRGALSGENGAVRLGTVEHLANVLEECDVMAVGKRSKVWVEVADAYEIAAVVRLHNLDVTTAHQAESDDCQLHRGHASLGLQQFR